MLEPQAGKPSSRPDQVRIATAYFSPTGFAHIADHLKRVENVRLLLGADLASDALRIRKRLNETFTTYEHRAY